MPRYIDADKLWDNRPQVPEGRSLDYGAGFSECMWGFSKLIRNQIDNPSGEVVEVVRCKDCEYYISPDRGYPYCSIMSNEGEGEYYTPSGDHYCSYGERKE